ncbi:hypothetical protein PAAG_11787 [Paracoccidioides lutzii Pb01]|uniref:Uncharacterized protein n=1 Tax=Paracoccidioides lutzii (strain ATCC MYA-826 / Pb01) TaxID=502779 RepID=A0A0A2V5B7_PARBA|nr:hypothetical protein PAAG_11787 [Paracoccidioides lutzii Pb01]KGQ01547.1 hypothetical protein PAAG_11787 [Paracoccidioides lutzii Pb01]
MARFRLFRLLGCDGEDADPQEKPAVPPPEYRSVVGNLNPAIQGLPIVQPRKIGFYLFPANILEDDDNEKKWGGIMDTASKGMGNGQGKFLTNRTPQNTFLMHDGTVKWAMHLNQHDAVRRLIGRGAEVNMVLHKRYTDLHHAVSQGDQELIVNLLKYGADINVTDNEGNTPLHCALNHWLKITDTYEDGGDDFALPIIKLLAEKGADLEAHNRYGNTVLHEACIYGDGLSLIFLSGHNNPGTEITHRRLTMAKYLLKLGIPVDTRDKWGSTPLLRCCTMRTPDRNVIALLLENGADVHSANHQGDTVLDAVCFQRDTELLKQVTERAIKNVADTNTGNDGEDTAHAATADLFNKPTILSTPLHYAAQHSGPDRVFFLLSHGAKPRTPTYATGATPLHLIASTSNATATDRPSSPSATSSTSSTTATATTTMTAIANPITQKINLLISHGADINARDLRGATPLHYAARNVESRHQERIVAALLAAGAEPDCKDLSGRTPLMELEGYWVLKGAVVKRLVEAGAERVEGMQGLGGFEYMDRDGIEG